MCLAVPGKILALQVVEANDVKQGDYILAHAGIAISVVDEKEAEETLKDLKELQKCVS